jgi:tetratricopeptide (TPR) repeat protein
MRRLAKLALLAVTLSLGCGVEPVTVPTPVAPESKAPVLNVAFDDIPVAKAKVVPMSLTSSTGAGLSLVALKGRAVVDEPLAFTELHLTFENPEERTLEGNFTIVLPQGAAVSRFAMKNDQGWQEGEVVEKQRAREAYEDSLHRRQDPALLEQNAGNEFNARVFPIPARGRKELILSYTQEITPATPYVLPLQGLPKVGELDVEAHLAGKAAPLLSLVQHDAVPTADFRLDGKLPTSAGRPALRNGEIVVARVAPVVSSQPEPLQTAMILVDTSASRALGMADEAKIVAQLCAAMARAHGDRGRVMVALYDQVVVPVYEGPAAGFGAEALNRIRQRMALGASDLGGVLAWAGHEAQTRGLSRVVLVTDGVPTVGETSGDKLRALTAGLKASGVERLDAVAVGGIRDDDLLRSIATSGLAHGGTVIDGGKDPEEIWRRLSEATRSGLKVDVEGAKFVFPRVVDGVQAGDEVLVYATVPEGQAVRISVGGERAVPVDPVRAERPLLERAWVGAKLRSLADEERISGPSEALSSEIVQLSTRYRVLSPKTALLVLESDADYARFGFDRRGLADILVADGGRVSLLTRALPQIAKVALPAQPSKPNKKTSWGKGVAKPKVAMGAEEDEKPSPGAQSRGGHADAPPMRMVPDLDGANEPPPPPPPRPAPGQREMVRRPSSPSGGAPPAMKPADKSDSANRDGDESPSAYPAPSAAPRPVMVPRPADGPRPVAAAAAAPPPSPPPPPPPPAATAAAALARDMAPPLVQPSADQPFHVVNGRLVMSETGAAQAPKPPKEDPYTGPFKEVMSLLADHKIEAAIKAAFEWRKREPGDVMALVALGEAFEAWGDYVQAARCYGSIIDLFPGRADLRRFAGQRLERLPPASGLDLASDSFAKAVEQRPDHPESHRLLAYALLRRGRPEQAFAAIVAGRHRSYPSNRFAGVPRILAEDEGLIAAAWAKADPKRANEIMDRVRADGGVIEDEPSIRFVLNWETDANDVDFHIFDSAGGHAFYGDRTLPSGGELYADVTTGYGPECFTIRKGPSSRQGPYKLQAHYYSRGPMGYGMGKLEIIEHDGKGGLHFEERPFVVMVDQAFVDLGTVDR